MRLSVPSVARNQAAVSPNSVSPCGKILLREFRYRSFLRTQRFGSIPEVLASREITHALDPEGILLLRPLLVHSWRAATRRAGPRTAPRILELMITGGGPELAVDWVV